MVRKAQIKEVPEIYRFLPEFADAASWPGLADLYSQLRDYFVYREEQGPLLGVAALHICWADLGEIRSLAVLPEHQKKGSGSHLVTNACQRRGPG